MHNQITQQSSVTYLLTHVTLTLTVNNWLMGDIGYWPFLCPCLSSYQYLSRAVLKETTVSVFMTLRGRRFH